MVMHKVFMIFMLGVLFGQPIMAQSNQTLRDSLANATDILAYHPDSVDLRLKKVAWNIKLEQWQYAKDDLDKVLHLQPTNVAGLFYRAFVNQKLNRYNFARLDYQNLLAIVPGNFEAELGLALLNQKDMHYTESYDEINNLVDQYPDSAVAYAARAGIEDERQMKEVAEYDYSKAFQLDSANIDYLLNRANLRMDLKRFDDAEADLNLAVKLGYPRGALIGYYRKLRDMKKK
jgi:Tfp pilus assembly protein PilF